GVRLVSWANGGGMAAVKMWSSDADLDVSRCTFISANSKHLDVANIDNTYVGWLNWQGNSYNTQQLRINVGATQPQIRNLAASGTATITAGNTTVTVAH